MDPTALFRLSYGLFVLTARDGGKDNGCIINTAGQVTDAPPRLTIAVQNANFTRDMILASGGFNVSVLSESAKFDLFTRFGFQSGRNVDKFDGFGACARSANGLLYVTEGTNAFISGKVTDSVDLGSHTLFIADVTDAEVLSDKPSATYAYYHANIKPKPQQKAETKDVVWRCTICGWEYNETKGEPSMGIAPGTGFTDLPDDFLCVICGHGKEYFEKV